MYNKQKPFLKSNILNTNYFNSIILAIAYLFSGIALSEIIRFDNSNLSIHAPYTSLLNCFGIIIPISFILSYSNWIKDWVHNPGEIKFENDINQFYSRNIYYLFLLFTVSSYSYVFFCYITILDKLFIFNNKTYLYIENLRQYYIPDLPYIIISILIITIIITTSFRKYLYYFTIPLYIINFLLYWQSLLSNTKTINSDSNISYFQIPVILLFLLTAATLSYGLSLYLFKSNNFSELRSRKFSIIEKGKLIHLLSLAAAQSSLFIGLFL